MARQDAITLLDEDHNQVAALFQQYKAARENNRKRVLAQQIFQELHVHTRIEEEVFYPAYRQATGNQEMVEHSEHEHREALDLIAKMENAPEPDDKLMLELEDAILHHVNDEREKMFPQARKTRGLDLDALADQLEQRKAELMATH